MEKPRILIDTTILIDYYRKKIRNKSIFYQLSLKYNFVISTITEFEFLVGFKVVNQKFGADIMKKMLIIPFDSKFVREGCKIHNELKTINKLIPYRDIFIAATARLNELELATLNTKHFHRIKNLKLIKLEKYK